MINFSSVTLRRGPRKLLDDLSFTIYPGWRVGVVGRNGTGKSTPSMPKGPSVATVLLK